MGNTPRSTQVSEIITVRHRLPGQIVSHVVSIAPDIDLEVHINKNSFKIVQLNDDFFLSFTFDSLKTCFITIYYFGTEVLNKTEDHTLYFTVNTEKYPTPSSYKFLKGFNQTFPEGASSIKLNNFACDIIVAEANNIYPIIVTIRPESESPNPYESSFIKLSKDGYSWKPTVVMQKMHLEGSSYYLNEIYGLSRTVHDSDDCIICLSGKSIVTMMPCKHLCLCQECAKILSESNVKKCPICRTSNLYIDVNEFIYISK
jgi:E3 ubiquitin-protein ligase MGRN1